MAAHANPLRRYGTRFQMPTDVGVLRLKLPRDLQRCRHVNDPVYDEISSDDGRPVGAVTVPFNQHRMALEIAIDCHRSLKGGAANHDYFPARFCHDSGVSAHLQLALDPSQLGRGSAFDYDI